MLFLGLGTGLGSALVWNRNVLSLELSDLPYIDNQTVEDHLSDAGLERVGSKNWEARSSTCRRGIQTSIHRRLCRARRRQRQAPQTTSRTAWNSVTTAMPFSADSVSGRSTPDPPPEMEYHLSNEQFENRS